MIAVNPHGGMNSYWPMPFRSAARLTLENLAPSPATVYYQISYELGTDEEHSGYLHAHWRRSNPLSAGSVHSLLDEVRGTGQYVGSYLAWGVNSRGWWGEGEIKFYLDGDEEFPTICGTGTEDYFGGAWNFDVPGQGYTAYSTPYLGLHQIIRPDGLYESQQRFGMYRWHVPDPIHFTDAVRVDIQALGWRSGGRYLPRHDDIASTASLLPGRAGRLHPDDTYPRRTRVPVKRQAEPLIRPPPVSLRAGDRAATPAVHSVAGRRVLSDPTSTIARMFEESSRPAGPDRPHPAGPRPAAQAETGRLDRGHRPGRHPPSHSRPPARPTVRSGRSVRLGRRRSGRAGCAGRPVVRPRTTHPTRSMPVIRRGGRDRPIPGPTGG